MMLLGWRGGIISPITTKALHNGGTKLVFAKMVNVKMILRVYKGTYLTPAGLTTIPLAAYGRGGSEDTPRNQILEPAGLGSGHSISSADGSTSNNPSSSSSSSSSS